MKKFARIMAATLSVLLALGAVAVSADDTPTEEVTESVAEEPIAIEEYAEMPVFLTIEGPDELMTIMSGLFPVDGSVTVADVVADMMAENFPEIEINGLEEGYITSLDGVEGGIFGGWDGWLYAVKYYMADEDGNVQLYIDIPTVGIDEYAILSSCQIVIYYGDFDIPFAGMTMTEDNMIKLVQFTAVYDENYTLIAFDESPLAGGSFDFIPVIVDEETGEISVGETISFVADENGVTELDYEFRALPNGTYYGSIGMQSETSAEIDGETITAPAAVRASDVYVVDNHPTEEELRQAEEAARLEQIQILLIGML
ncbi:MAG: DUF4430 domain-containing protein [Clostridiales bacterium]|nr:DUF4430 domain-containing protein [Clostridiales bacterium]